jgi:hypothetical protein
VSCTKVSILPIVPNLRQYPSHEISKSEEKMFLMFSLDRSEQSLSSHVSAAFQDAEERILLDPEEGSL